jgi:hypothetical protein
VDVTVSVAVSMGKTVSVAAESVGSGATNSVGGAGAAVGAAQAAPMKVMKMKARSTFSLKGGTMKSIVMDLGFSLNKTGQSIYH